VKYCQTAAEQLLIQKNKGGRKGEDDHAIFKVGFKEEGQIDGSPSYTKS